MTWNIGNGSVTGGSRDDNITRFDAELGSTTPTSETTYTALGSDRCVKLPVGTNGSKALCATGGDINGNIADFGTNHLTMLTFDVGGGATTSPTAIIYDDTSQGGLNIGGANNKGVVVLNNSPRVLEIYDGAGTKQAASVSTWSTSALTRFYVMIDCLDGTNNTKLAIWNKYRVLESYQVVNQPRGTFFTNTRCFFGDWPDAGTNRGADLYGGVIVEQSNDTADNPLWQRYPMLSVCGGGALPPTAEGSFSEWTGTKTTAAPNGYQDVDDLGAPGSHPGNDGDTSLQSDGTPGHRFTMTYSAANPLPTGAIVRFVELGTAFRTLSGKAAYNGMLYDGTNTLILPYVQPSTSYVGSKCSTTLNPAGSAWSRSDFDLSGGKSTLQFGGRSLTDAERGGASIGGRMTDQPGPSIVYHDGTQFLQTFGSGY